MTLPPEPWLVQEYFRRHRQASLETGYTAEDLAYNDALWKAICEHGAAALSPLGREERNHPPSDAVVTPEALSRQSAHRDRAEYMRRYRHGRGKR